MIARHALAACVAAVAWAGAVAPLAGCGALPGAPPVVAQCSEPNVSDRPGPALVGQTYGMAMTPLPLNSVQFGAMDIARSMAIQSLYASRTPTGTVQVAARLLSCADTPVVVRLRTSFLQSSTAPAEPASAWHDVFLAPRATAVYTEMSTSVDAATYLVEITH
jgi:hypothetical protein